jgi:hypothetical protein
VTTRRSLATGAAILLILAAGSALLYVARAQLPPSSGATPSPTSTATVAASTAAAVTTSPSKTGSPIGTVVSCGVVVVNSVTSGQGSGPNTWELLSPTGVSIARFGWDAGQSALGTYLCVRLIPGAPMEGFSALIRPGEAGYVPQPTLVATDSCGSVTAYSSDGAHMLVTLSAGGTQTQYDLQFQFVGGTAPTDIGTRLAAGMPQLLLITGAQVAPDNGSPSAISLRRYNVARVTDCTPTSSLRRRPSGFTLPMGCAYIDQPVVGADQTTWLFDCGAASNDARGSLTYPLTQQGWTLCGAVTATASWAKGTARLGIAEGAGGAGGYPKVTQPAQPAATSSCP